MNLIQLTYFEAVYMYKTTSLAAERLHISQPALSAAIKSLENEFGVTLFRRSKNGMLTTAEGEALFRLSRELTTRAEQIERIMNDLGSRQKLLRLGIPPMIGSLLLPRIFREFCPANPDIRLEITEGGRHELIADLEEERIDLVFLPHNQPLVHELCSVHAARLETVCCAAKNSALAEKKSIRPQELADTPLVLFKDSFFQTQEIKRRFSEEGVKPRILLQTDQLSTLTNIIASRLAAGFLFSELIDTDSGLVPIPLSDPMFVDVSLAHKKSAQPSSSMKRFLDYVSRSFGQ